MTQSDAPPPRRVLHVMRMRAVSGAENHLRVLAASLRDLGWESDFVIPTPDSAPIEELAASLTRSGHRVFVVPMPHDFSPRLVRLLHRMGRSGRYDLINAHLVHADWHLALATRLGLGIPIVSTKHNPDPFRDLLPVRLMERWTMARYDEVIAISEHLAEYTRQSTGVDATTVRYGLAAPSGPPDGRPGAPRLLAVGRLERQKGFDVLISSMPHVLRAVPRAELVIVGEGRERPPLERLVRELDLDGPVTLLGRREDVPALMDSAAMLVHPARWEGFGLVLLEAMRSGLPVVATSVAAIPEVVEDGVTGVLVPPDDPERLAGAITSLLLEPERARAAGMAGFERLRRRFTPERMAEGVAAVYERAAAS